MKYKWIVAAGTLAGGMFAMGNTFADEFAVINVPVRLSSMLANQFKVECKLIPYEGCSGCVQGTGESNPTDISGGAYNGTVRVPVNLDARGNPEEARRYTCGLWLHAAEGWRFAPGPTNANIFMKPKPGTPFTWQVTGEVPPPPTFTVAPIRVTPGTIR